jgi:hypothetical protein
MIERERESILLHYSTVLQPSSYGGQDLCNDIHNCELTRPLKSHALGVSLTLQGSVPRSHALAHLSYTSIEGGVCSTKRLND